MGRQGADPYEYVEKDNKPVGDGASQMRNEMTFGLEMNPTDS